MHMRKDSNSTRNPEDQTREQLIDRVEDLQAMVTALDKVSIISMANVDGTITYANDRFCEQMGYSREELIGQNHRIVRSDEHPPEFFGEMWSTIRRGDIWHGEVKNRTKAGDGVWYETHIVPVSAKDPRRSGFIAFRQDITERKLLQTQLTHAQKMEAIGQLAAGIAHEINTPTQYVGDNTRFVRDSVQDLLALADEFARFAGRIESGESTQDDARALRAAIKKADLDFLRDEVPKAIEQTLDGVERVAEIVRAMKDFSHPGEVEATAADLNKAISSTITVCRNRWKYVADVETDFQEDLPSTPCLVSEFNQVILNLIVNAADAIADVVGDADEGKGTITISTRRVGDEVEVRVSDTGTGIPEDMQRKVFEPFFTTKEVGKGTGQGLAISHDVIVNKHGGSIGVESSPGEGTTFIIRLPLQQAAEPPIREAA